VETGKVLTDSDEVRDAFKTGAISWDQAAEIATADNSRPGAAAELLDIAARESFQVYESGPARSSWSPSSTVTSAPASTPPAVPAATPTTSA
jgi:hypothetical protein